jgi:diacylglycerol kinase (ATP)
VHQLVFVVNPASGEGRGGGLAEQLMRLPGPCRVAGLGADLVHLAREAQQQGAALVACGGDGTASAALEAAYQAHCQCPALPPPAVGVLPLGTGNDLARVLGWGSGRDGTAQLAVAVARLRQASIAHLDRWVLAGCGRQRPWFNYWSMGIDARIVARFHQLRRRYPRLVRGSVTNRLLYAALGLSARADALPASVRLPGMRPLPSWANTVVMSNIPSYAGGARLCADQHYDDGKAEVVVLGHGVVLGLATAGWKRPHHLTDVTSLQVVLSRPTAMQCDGEPFRAPSGSYRIALAGQVRVLRAGV